MLLNTIRDLYVSIILLCYETHMLTKLTPFVAYCCYFEGTHPHTRHMPIGLAVDRWNRARRVYITRIPSSMCKIRKIFYYALKPLIRAFQTCS